MNRRKFISAIVALGSTAVAGCSGDNNGGVDDGGQEETLIDDRVEVSEDGYHYWELPINSATTVSHDIIVREGPNIDFLVFEPSEFEHYKDQENARILSEASERDMGNYQDSADYPEGEYRVVIDNTEFSEAEPPSNLDDDVADVEITLAA